MWIELQKAYMTRTEQLLPNVDQFQTVYLVRWQLFPDGSGQDCGIRSRSRQRATRSEVACVEVLQKKIVILFIDAPSVEARCSF